MKFENRLLCTRLCTATFAALVMCGALGAFAESDVPDSATTNATKFVGFVLCSMTFAESDVPDSATTNATTTVAQNPESFAGASAGEKRIVGDIETVWCPPGTFTPGSPENEIERDTDERQHEVTLTRGFWMSRTEVTHAQWKAVMATSLEEQVRKALEDDTRFSYNGRMQTSREYWGLTKDADPAKRLGNTDENLPMHYVNWYEAMEFCERLTRRDRDAGRIAADCTWTLPTEAQWEYACRAGATNTLYNGSMKIVGRRNAPALDPIAWYSGNSSVGYEGVGWDTSGWEDKQYPCGRAGPRAVGTKQANAWGLHDTLGNVWELCASLYGDYPAGAATDPAGAFTSTPNVVIRGGAWDTAVRDCRSANRGWDFPGIRNAMLGFRVVLVQE